MIAGSGKGRSTNVELGERPLPYLGNSNQPVKGALASKLLKSRGDGHDAKEPGMPPVAHFSGQVSCPHRPRGEVIAAVGCPVGYLARVSTQNHFEIFAGPSAAGCANDFRPHSRYCVSAMPEHLRKKARLR